VKEVTLRFCMELIYRELEHRRPRKDILNMGLIIYFNFKLEKNIAPSNYR
jgi:hypothetical protein